MKKIVCYRRGCNNAAKWTVPGNPTVHLCTRHMRELFPKQVLPQEIKYGPTEFKDVEEGNVEIRL